MQEHKTKTTTSRKQTPNDAAGVSFGFSLFSQRTRSIWTKKPKDTLQEYRQFYLASDIPQARLVIFLLTLPIAFFIISDYTFFGFNYIFYGLALLRVGLVAYCAFQFMHLKKVKDYRLYDRSVFILSLTIVLGILLVNFTRPENFIPHIIVIDMAVFLFYLVLPTRFIFQALPSLIFTIGELIIVTFTFPLFMEPGLITALFSLGFANVIGALSSLQMSSYRWRIYEHLKERKETERLAAIGQTAGMIGHDIRNPLQAITSELYIARASITESPMPPEIKNPALESIELIEEQTDYISKIVSDLQDYARPLKPEIKEIETTKLIASVFQMVRVPATITLKIDIKELPKISTDPTLIRRAITNLVNNAIQAMPEGGTLSLSAQKTPNATIIEVSDTGRGVPEEIKPRLFTPLVTTKAKGQGLGLAVVKRIVEVLGGSIVFESEVGKGTRFVISLPVAE